MTNVILCPFHKEQTPSCIIKKDGFFCLGCGKSGTLKELTDAGVVLPQAV